MYKKNIIFLARISLLLLTLLLLFPWPASAIVEAAANQAGDIYLPLIANRYSTEPGYGTVVGTVWDARTNQFLEGAVVCYEDTICDSTDNQGRYLLTPVPNGGHTFTANSIGYVEGIEFDNVVTGYTTEVDFVMLPVLDDGEFRVVVTWDSTPVWPPEGRPNDLNLHMWANFPPPDHHIYIGNKGNCENLDVAPYTCYETDEQYGSGPDTIIVANQNNNYKFAVLNYYDLYPGVPTIDELGVRVQIYNNAGLMAEYWVETASGEGDLWYVFDLSFGVIDSQNCLVQYDEPGDNPPSCP